MTFWWILFYVLWLCETQNTFLLLLALQDRQKNNSLISSIWNESNLILLDQKSVCIVLNMQSPQGTVPLQLKWFSVITEENTLWLRKQSGLVFENKMTLASTQCSKTVDKSAWRWFVLKTEFKERCYNDLQKWVKGYSPAISITNHLNFQGFDSSKKDISKIYMY